MQELALNPSVSDFCGAFAFARHRVEMNGPWTLRSSAEKSGRELVLSRHASAIAAIEIFNPGIFTGSFAP